MTSRCVVVCRWDRLNRLRMNKEKNLEGANSIELFQNTCGELKDWMREKRSELDTDDLGRDLASVRALQRKHNNLENELDPLQEKLKKMKLLANAYVDDVTLRLCKSTILLNSTLVAECARATQTRRIT